MSVFNTHYRLIKTTNGSFYIFFSAQVFPGKQVNRKSFFKVMLHVFNCWKDKCHRHKETENQEKQTDQSSAEHTKVKSCRHKELKTNWSFYKSRCFTLIEWVDVSLGFILSSEHSTSGSHNKVYSGLDLQPFFTLCKDDYVNKRGMHNKQKDSLFHLFLPPCADTWIGENWCFLGWFFLCFFLLFSYQEFVPSNLTTVIWALSYFSITFPEESLGNEANHQLLDFECSSI